MTENCDLYLSSLYSAIEDVRHERTWSLLARCIVL